LDKLDSTDIDGFEHMTFMPSDNDRDIVMLPATQPVELVRMRSYEIEQEVPDAEEGLVMEIDPVPVHRAADYDGECEMIDWSATPDDDIDIDFEHGSHWHDGYFFTGALSGLEASKSHSLTASSLRVLCGRQISATAQYVP
jgi:hypothetical protein